MWDLYRQYHSQKDRSEQFIAEQREKIQKASSSVRRWLNTPVTHITSVQMKRFRKYKEQVSVDLIVMKQEDYNSIIQITDDLSMFNLFALVPPNLNVITSR